MSRRSVRVSSVIVFLLVVSRSWPVGRSRVRSGATRSTMQERAPGPSVHVPKPHLAGRVHPDSLVCQARSGWLQGLLEEGD